MELSINTELLQSLTVKVMKGASQNKMIPITSMICLQTCDGKFKMISTDATNYLEVSCPLTVSEDFYVVVQADLFAKLISKLTCETTVFEVSEDIMKVRGNGEYSIELPLDEEGQTIKYPNPFESFAVASSSELSLSDLKLVLSSAKSALAKDLTVPCYTGYYMHDKVISTNTDVACCVDIDMLESPKLMSSAMLDLCDVMTSESIICKFGENDTVVLESTDCRVYGKFMDCIDDYQIDVISKLFESEDFGGYCKLSKSKFLGVLDRLSLFVGPYDRNCIYMTFVRDGILITSKKTTGSEKLEYMETNDYSQSNEYTCCVDIEMLQTQIKANVGDIIEIWFGATNVLMISDGSKVTQIVSLNTDESFR